MENNSKNKNLSGERTYNKKVAITELQLTQEEANQLIFELKRLTKNISRTVDTNTSGTLPIVSKSDNRKFKIAYFYSPFNVHINFFDVKTGLSLVRLNLNNSFHRNADGSKITGNRVNPFSEQEFNLKNDGKTHMRAFPLPHDVLKNTSDFLDALTNLLEYTHTEYKDKLHLSLSTNLDV